MTANASSTGAPATNKAITPVPAHHAFAPTLPPPPPLASGRCATSDQSLWEVPGPARAVQATLPRGWSAHLADDSVHFYYFAEVDGRSQWEVPTSPAEARGGASSGLVKSTALVQTAKGAQADAAAVFEEILAEIRAERIAASNKKSVTQTSSHTCQPAPTAILHSDHFGAMQCAWCRSDLMSELGLTDKYNAAEARLIAEQQRRDREKRMHGARIKLGKRAEVVDDENARGQTHAPLLLTYQRQDARHVKFASQARAPPHTHGYSPRPHVHVHVPRGGVHSIESHGSSQVAWWEVPHYSRENTWPIRPSRSGGDWRDVVDSSEDEEEVVAAAEEHQHGVRSEDEVATPSVVAVENVEVVIADEEQAEDDQAASEEAAAAV